MNQERVCRSLASDINCSYCGATTEDSLHVLQDYTAAIAIWSIVIKPELLEVVTSNMQRHGVPNRFCSSSAWHASLDLASSWMGYVQCGWVIPSSDRWCNMWRSAAESSG
ncbi:hypothetical protein V6N13_001739 [Hibiscus sabdariffa]